jgi:hypothetical protein
VKQLDSVELQNESVEQISLIECISDAGIAFIPDNVKP